MISRFCSLCNYFIDTSLKSVRKYSVKVKHSRVTFRNEKHNKKKQNVKQVEDDKIPIIICKRNELNFYYGDTFSKFKPILASNGWYHDKSKGDYFTIHTIQNKSSEPETQIPAFKTFNFNEKLIENLEKHDFEKPTKIQMKAFPSLLDGLNTIIAAETGSGKTLAYLLPLIEQILYYKIQINRSMNTPLGLIITPSRELAIQIARETKKLTKGLNINTKVLIGGRTKKILRNPPVNSVDIIVATLGILSKFVSNHIYKVNCIQHVVLDEADSLFHETFHFKLKPFLRKIKFCYCRSNSNKDASGAQLTLTSATMPNNISEVLEDFINIDSLSSITTDKLHNVHVPQKFFRLGPSQKPMMLLKLIKLKSRKKQPIIIFTNKSSCCDWLSRFLKEFGVENIHLNGKMSVTIRRGKFADFQSGRSSVLCTTDAGSRGLDTIMVKEIINYDFPLQTAEYIHRCGRTGRIGSPNDCRVINFITRPLEISLTRKLELAARKGKPIPMIDMLQNPTMIEYGSMIDTIEKMHEEKESEEDFENSINELYIPS